MISFEQPSSNNRVRPTKGYGGLLDSTVWERIRASSNFEEPDRVPIWDYIDNPEVLRHFKRPEDDYDTAMVRVYHGLGIDLCRGYGRSFEKEENGTILSGGTTTHRIAGQTAWKVRYEIESLEELKQYINTAQPVSWDWIKKHWVNDVRVQQQRFAPYTLYVPGHGCGFHDAYGLMGQERFSYFLYDAPNEIRALLEITGESAYRFAKVAAQEQLSPLYFIGDDIAYKNGLFFSLHFLRQTFIPMLRRCIEVLHDGGIKVIYHSDGNLWSIMDDLMDVGIDGLNPLEPLAGMDLSRLKKRYGKRLILVGGIDCSVLLPLGTKDEIWEAVRQAVAVAAPGGGFFIGSSSEITPATPLENVLAFYEACRTLGRYPAPFANHHHNC
ncbi:MAG: hypothetical protein NZ959_09900 [Armatimonadetes bacterium]|nr:hypothetical protein [Armatimonadota bacterium]MDW8122758.1 uroporphyrinogen decarboxylase family protein [Armatimonadota bacterium]